MTGGRCFAAAAALLLAAACEAEPPTAAQPLSAAQTAPAMSVGAGVPEEAGGEVADEPRPTGEELWEALEAEREEARPGALSRLLDVADRIAASVRDGTVSAAPEPAPAAEAPRASARPAPRAPVLHGPEGAGVALGRDAARAAGAVPAARAAE